MTSTREFPLAVIGAGPCGLGVGVAARLAGLPCTIFDQSCVVSAIANYPTHMTFFSTAEKLELGGVPFTSIAEKPTRREALKYYQRIVRHFQLDVRQYERVDAVERVGEGFGLLTTKKDGTEASYQAANLVVATGYLDTPCLLGIPGEDLANVSHYYREGSPYFDQRCVVIGAGNSAVDAALDLYRWGAHVTLVHFADALDPGVKPWILPDIVGRLKNNEIAVRWKSRITEIRQSSVLVESIDTGGVEELQNDWVFAMTGYRPDPRLLRSLGVEIDPQSGIPCYEPSSMQTNQSGVYIAGVIAAGLNANKIFIENGREHGPKIVAGVLGR
jgi:thioredoxin reductase (NADPH)